MPMIKELTTEDLLYDARENNKKLKQEINKYKQALEEIREIIQKCEIENISCVQCKERERCDCDLLRFVIAKIDEVFSNDRD